MIRGHANIKINRFCGGEQPVDMFIRKGPGPVIKTQPFPDTITQHEATVINADQSLSFRHNPSVQVDQDFFVTGVFLGLVGCHVIGHLVLLSGTLLARWVTVPIRVWIVGGCLLSGTALAAMGFGGQMADRWPIAPNVFLLGLANGIFAVAAIGAMMGLAREGTEAREGARMGVFGAAQAIAFGLGAFLGTAAADIMRALTRDDATAYGAVFITEAALFFVAALLALRITTGRTAPNAALVPGE